MKDLIFRILTAPLRMILGPLDSRATRMEEERAHRARSQTENILNDPSVKQAVRDFHDRVKGKE